MSCDRCGSYSVKKGYCDPCKEKTRSGSTVLLRPPVARGHAYDPSRGATKVRVGGRIIVLR